MSRSTGSLTLLVNPSLCWLWIRKKKSHDYSEKCFDRIFGLATGRMCNDQKDGEKAQSLNTMGPYDEFLTKHPESEFTADAKDRIQELHWQNAKKIDTRRDYREFITIHLQCEFTREAKRRIEDLEWDEVQRLNTLEAYQEFLQRYPLTLTLSHKGRGDKRVLLPMARPDPLLQRDEGTYGYYQHRWESDNMFIPYDF